MTINGITGNTQPAAVTGPATTQEDPLGRDTFLKLLVTQLANQNPLEPQPDGEFLAQLAQFSSLEQLQEMKADISTLVGYFELLASEDSGDDGGAGDSGDAGGAGDTSDNARITGS